MKDYVRFWLIKFEIKLKTKFEIHHCVAKRLIKQLLLSLLHRKNLLNRNNIPRIDKF